MEPADSRWSKFTSAGHATNITLTKPKIKHDNEAGTLALNQMLVIPLPLLTAPIWLTSSELVGKPPPSSKVADGGSPHLQQHPQWSV